MNRSTQELKFGLYQPCKRVFFWKIALHHTSCNKTLFWAGIVTHHACTFNQEIRSAYQKIEKEIRSDSEDGTTIIRVKRRVHKDTRKIQHFSCGKGTESARQVTSGRKIFSATATRMFSQSGQSNVMGMHASARLASDRLKRMASRALKGIARSVQLARWKVPMKRPGAAGGKQRPSWPETTARTGSLFIKFSSVIYGPGSGCSKLG